MPTPPLLPLSILPVVHPPTLSYHQPSLPPIILSYVFRHHHPGPTQHQQQQQHYSHSSRRTSPTGNQHKR
ncbi:hypothetical protein E2C01_046713 [Portunus trituberculatus]|uniref:Uncharacterized protein n=1 Tax=Portunus trituberculatus TaxID=210409 RepID=A0A5B7G8H9_PORTR|nr:hypothetical protein [Portunus trituberculatus]